MPPRKRPHQARGGGRGGGEGGGGGRGGDSFGGGGGRGGGGGGRGFKSAIAVPEEIRMAVNLKLQDFRNKEDENEFEFPSSLGSQERCYIHRYSNGA
jgi:hypothetical protein